MFKPNPPRPPAGVPASGAHQEVSGGNAASAVGDGACGASTVSGPGPGSGHHPAPPFDDHGGA